MDNESRTQVNWLHIDQGAHQTIAALHGLPLLSPLRWLSATAWEDYNDAADLIEDAEIESRLGPRKEKWGYGRNV